MHAENKKACMYECKKTNALVRRLEVELIAHDGKFVVLEFLERLLTVNVKHNTRGVNHARAKEPVQTW